MKVLQIVLVLNILFFATNYCEGQSNPINYNFTLINYNFSVVAEIHDNEYPPVYYLKLRFPGLSDTEINGLTNIHLVLNASGESSTSNIQLTIPSESCTIPNINMGFDEAGCNVIINISNPKITLEKVGGEYQLDFHPFQGTSTELCPIMVVDIDGTIQDFEFCTEIDANFCGGNYSYLPNNSISSPLETVTKSFDDNELNGSNTLFCYGSNPYFSINGGKTEQKEINSLKQSSKNRIYPNPANEKITIEWEEIKKAATIEIYNTNGQLFYQEKVTEISKKEINILDFPKGIYWVRTLINKELKTQKLVIN